LKSSEIDSIQKQYNIEIHQQINMTSLQKKEKRKSSSGRTAAENSKSVGTSADTAVLREREKTLRNLVDSITTGIRSFLTTLDRFDQTTIDKCHRQLHEFKTLYMDHTSHYVKLLKAKAYCFESFPLSLHGCE